MLHNYLWFLPGCLKLISFVFKTYFICKSCSKFKRIIKNGLGLETMVLDDYNFYMRSFNFMSLARRIGQDNSGILKSSC